MKRGQYVNSKKLDFKDPIFLSKPATIKKKRGESIFKFLLENKLRENPTNGRGFKCVFG